MVTFSLVTCTWSPEQVSNFVKSQLLLGELSLSAPPVRFLSILEHSIASIVRNRLAHVSRVASQD